MMKNWITIASVLAMLSCATPKYAFDFGQPKSAPSEPSSDTQLVASSTVPDRAPFTAALTETPEPQAAPATPGRVDRDQKSAHTADQLALQQDSKETTAKDKPTPLPGDLKRSVIFLIVGGLLLLVGSDTMVVLGSLSLLVGVIFGLKWLLRDRK